MVQAVLTKISLDRLKSQICCWDFQFFFGFSSNLSKQQAAQRTKLDKLERKQRRFGAIGYPVDRKPLELGALSILLDPLERLETQLFNRGQQRFLREPEVLSVGPWVVMVMK